MKKVLYILLLITFIICIDNIKAYTEYKVGDEVTYNDIQFYVIKDSSSDEDRVTLLKAEPLTVDEVATYGEGHINRYTRNNKDTVFNNNGYGGMVYYSSETCGYVNNVYVNTGCVNDYAVSEVKYVVDAWANDKFDNNLIEARIISLYDLMNNLGYDHASWNVSSWKVNPEYTPSWVYNSNYWYWTMNQYEDFTSANWIIDVSGFLNYIGIHDFGDNSVVTGVIRPVVTLKKTALSAEDESDVIENNISDSKDIKYNETKTIVKVDNTYMNSSIIIIIAGLIIAVLSVCVLYKICNKRIK